ncbi:DUF2254 domain-containing protein [Phytomonospora sp. NPDC050363]|uniref:DUF2254 domain-containing protein n=1 Tax=Phytomonospora sp. NPDC050363 TaxID=3155642 RepID=UPI0033FB2DA3
MAMWRRPRSPIREHLRDTLWFAPLVAMVLAWGLVWLATSADEVIVGGARSAGGVDAVASLQSFSDAARGIISGVAAAMLTFVGVVFSISLVALQMASSQFSPRVLRLYVRSRITKATLSVTLATFVFALCVQLGYDDEKDPELLVSVPIVSALIALVLVQICLVLFVLYVNSTLRLMRVTFVMERIVAETMRALRYWHLDTDFAPLPAEPDAVVRHSGRSGVLRDVHLSRLIRIARRAGAVVEVVPEVGDFLTTGTPVFRVHGGTPVRARGLVRCLSVGTERSMYQDVGFGLRQLTDICIRALSAAINDPTTAVAAIDRLHQVLARVITEPDSATAWRDRRGRLRVVLAEPSFAGMIAQAFTEVRLCGVGTPQVTRRLMAALDDLEAIALPVHADAVRLERRLLVAAVEASGGGVADRGFALVPDRQGIS